MKSKHFLLALPCVLLSLAAVAAGDHGGDSIGKPGVAAQVTRAVYVEMTDDMRFHSSNITVKQGETIRFLAKNSCKVKHEMVLGTPQELKEHYAMMITMPEMAHADANMVTVAPGESGELIWQFTRAGKVDFACLQPGHFDAGMKGQIKVTGRNAVSKDETHVHTHH